MVGVVSLWQENGILERGDGGAGDRARFSGEGELMRGWILLFVMLDLVSDVAYQVTTPVTGTTQFRSLALQHPIRRRVGIRYVSLDRCHAIASALRLGGFN